MTLIAYLWVCDMHNNAMKLQRINLQYMKLNLMLNWTQLAYFELLFSAFSKFSLYMQYHQDYKLIILLNVLNMLNFNQMVAAFTRNISSGITIIEPNFTVTDIMLPVPLLGKVSLKLGLGKLLSKAITVHTRQKFEFHICRKVVVQSKVFYTFLSFS